MMGREFRNMCVLFFLYMSDDLHRLVLALPNIAQVVEEEGYVCMMDREYVCVFVIYMCDTCWSIS